MEGRDSEIEEESPRINMTEIEKGASVNESLLPIQAKPDGKSVKAINLGRNFDQIIYLESLVQRQFSKNKELIRFIQYDELVQKQKRVVELETNRGFAHFRPTCPTIGSDTKYQI